MAEGESRPVMGRTWDFSRLKGSNWVGLDWEFTKRFSMPSCMSKDLAFDGKFPVRRRESKIEKSSGSRSTNGIESSEFEIFEKIESGPARDNVCLVVWKSCPPTSIVTMFEFQSRRTAPVVGDFGPAKGGIFITHKKKKRPNLLEIIVKYQRKRGLSEEFVGAHMGKGKNKSILHSQEIEF
ncbi:primosomal replication protein n [Striga asiatica]|uniref:Primosomal replication protein n n=1 Tax=Striga asiatica TaxID=4170 RepID=A0A5A7PCR2_STRAF|nr:primosomal replication protein n [Striga asiatica]